MVKVEMCLIRQLKIGDVTFKSHAKTSFNIEEITWGRIYV